MEETLLLPPAPSPRRLPGAAGAWPHARPEARRIVVACGEVQVGELVERVLRAGADEVGPAGVDVRRVADGVACLQAIEMRRPDLLVLHARLDRMTPLEILEAWDRLHPGERLPAIVLSSAFGSDVPRGVTGIAVVNLPFDNGRFVDLVARALEG